MHNFNPWHHVSPEFSEDMVNGIIEIPKGGRAKYELDKDNGLLRLDRVLYSSVYYPANYGFIPHTLGEDNDPLDILILSRIEVVPLCIVPAKIIGVMRMLDNGEADDKIIAVAAGDPSVNHYSDISELPPYHINEAMSFFEDYTKMEDKVVVVEKFLDKKTAIDILKASFERYQVHYGALHNFIYGKK